MHCHRNSEARAADPARARLVYSAAADLVETLRSTKPKYTYLEMLPGVLIAVAVAYVALHAFSIDMWRLFAPAPPSVPSS